MLTPVVTADIPANAGIDIFSQAVNGGTLYVTVIRDQTGSVLAISSSVVPGAALADQAPSAETTVGDGTLLAADVLGGLIVRSGSTADFTDTTDTAALIQAAWTGGSVGSSFGFTIRNTTAFYETLAGGAGVSFLGPKIVPPNSSADFLAVWTGEDTIEITARGVSALPLPAAKLSALNATTGSLPVGAITGAGQVTLISSNAAPGAQLVRPASDMLADIPNGQVGVSWGLRIVNKGAGTFTLTTDGGATVTLVGTMTIPQNTFRDFVVRIDGANAASITTTGNGTYS